MLRSEHRAYLEEGLQVLTVRERTALMLRDVEGLPAEEVARQLNCSKATVRSHIANARIKFRRYVDKSREGPHKWILCIRPKRNWRSMQAMIWAFGSSGASAVTCSTARMPASRYTSLQRGTDSLSDLAAELPADLNWNRLAQEMTGNIRVGLAAGECIAGFEKGIRPGRPRFFWHTAGGVRLAQPWSSWALCG